MQQRVLVTCSSLTSTRWLDIICSKSSNHEEAYQCTQNTRSMAPATTAEGQYDMPSR
jgi:hypothetical protein